MSDEELRETIARAAAASLARDAVRPPFLIHCHEPEKPDLQGFSAE